MPRAGRERSRPESVAGSQPVAGEKLARRHRTAPFRLQLENPDRASTSGGDNEIVGLRRDDLTRLCSRNLIGRCTTPDDVTNAAKCSQGERPGLNTTHLFVKGPVR